MSRKADEAQEIGRPLTPRSERLRSTLGQLQSGLQDIPGLCPEGKCFRRAGHAGECYPT